MNVSILNCRTFFEGSPDVTDTPLYIYITYVEFLVDDDALTGVRIKITRKTYLYTRTVNM